MIQIINISENLKPYGEHKYSLRINGKELCQFIHKREEGLSQCLKKAALAVDNEQWKVLIELMEDRSKP